MKTKRLIEEISAILTSVKAIEPIRDEIPLSLLEINDIVFSVSHIEDLIKSSPKMTVSDLKKNIATFLKKRWDLIANSTLCYTMNTDHPINWICTILADFYDKDHKNSLLMPTVATTDVATGTTINELEFGKFIISDDTKTFIDLTVLIDTACVRIHNIESNPYITTDVDAQIRNVTTAELQRSGIHERLESLRELATKGTNWFTRIFSSYPTLVNELTKLRAGLRRGDAAHEGAELEAGSPGYIAIIEFRTYYDTLPPSFQQEIGRFNHGERSLDDILNLIFRNGSHNGSNATGRETIFCLQLLGRYLDEFIESNRDSLIDLTSNNRIRIDRIKQRLTDYINQPRPLLLDHHVNFQNQQEKWIQVLNDTLFSVEQQNTVSSKRLFIALASFLANELNEKISPRRNASANNIRCTINLLLAIGHEANTYTQRSAADNILVLREIFKRIQLLSMCHSRSLQIGTPKATIAWRTFLQNEGVSLNVISPTEPQNTICSINEFIGIYPLNSQKQIITNELIELRAKEAEDKRIAEEKKSTSSTSQLGVSIINQAQSAISFFSRKPVIAAVSMGVLALGLLVNKSRSRL